MINGFLAYLVKVADIDIGLVDPQQFLRGQYVYYQCPLCHTLTSDWIEHERKHRAERTCTWNEAYFYAHGLGVELDDVYKSFITAYAVNEEYARQMIVDYLLNKVVQSK